MEDAYEVLFPDGTIGPEWICDDVAEALEMAREHGYDIEDVLERSNGGTYLVSAVNRA